MSKKDMFVKCDTCKNLDLEKSNHNWRVCKFQPTPIEILINGSDKCPKYEEKGLNHDTK